MWNTSKAWNHALNYLTFQDTMTFFKKRYLPLIRRPYGYGTKAKTRSLKYQQDRHAGLSHKKAFLKNKPVKIFGKRRGGNGFYLMNRLKN